MSKGVDIVRVTTTFMSTPGIGIRVLDSTQAHLNHFMDFITSDHETIISYILETKTCELSFSSRLHIDIYKHTSNLVL